MTVTPLKTSWNTGAPESVCSHQLSHHLLLRQKSTVHLCCFLLSEQMQKTEGNVNARHEQQWLKLMLHVAQSSHLLLNPRDGSPILCMQDLTVSRWQQAHHWFSSCDQSCNYWSFLIPLWTLISFLQSGIDPSTLWPRERFAFRHSKYCHSVFQNRRCCPTAELCF